MDTSTSPSLYSSPPMDLPKLISRRNWDLARRYTDFSASFPKEEEKVQIMADADANLPIYQAIKALVYQYLSPDHLTFDWSTGPNFHLRCRITALDPLNSKGTLDDPHHIELQPVEKLKSMPSVEPVPLSLIVNEEMSGFITIRRGQSVWPTYKVLEDLAIEQETRTRQAMYEFTRRSLRTGGRNLAPWEVEARIDAEIEKRINEDRAKDCTPMLQVLERLPFEVRSAIWAYALNLADPIWVGQYYDAKPYFPTSHPIADRPMATGLLRANRALAAEVSEALYTSRTFAFSSPSMLYQWLRPLNTRNLRKVRRIEMFMEPDVSLKFVQPGLGFTFGRYSTLLDGEKFSIKDFLEMVRVCPKLEFVLQMPSRHRMVYAFSRIVYSEDLYDGSSTECHFALCKWIVKGAMTAFEPYGNIIVSIRGDHSMDDRPEQLAELVALKECYSTVSWEDLGVKTGSIVNRPPDCECEDYCGRPIDEAALEMSQMSIEEL